MWKRALSRFVRPVLDTERGQSLIILAFSFIGLIALMGLGLDLGRVYVEKTALKRAIDAAALSGVTELSNEEEAILRAIDYLSLNDYDLTDSNIYVRGCIRDINNWYGSDLTWKGSAGAGDGNTRKLVNPPLGAPDDWFYPYQIVGNDEDVTNIFWINTYAYQNDHATACQNAGPSLPANVLGESNKIVITGTVKVDMSFFGLLGRPNFPVTERAVAQNQDNLDIVVVLDRSGSMEFDPVCYGCYERTASPNPSDTPPYSSYYTYPSNGVIYPVGGTSGFSNTTRIKACTTDTYDADGVASGPKNIYTFDPADTAYTDSNNYHYIVMEAELYSLNPAPVKPELQEQGKGYWALQRGEGNYSSNSEPWVPSLGTSIDDDGRPAHMAHHPSIVSQAGTIYGHHYTLTDAQNGNAPYLEYDFRFYPGAGWTAGNFYIWVRVHAGRGMDYDAGWWADPNPSNAYWALVSRDQSNPFPLNYFPTGAAQNLTNVTNSSLGYVKAWNGKWYPNYWRWIRIDPGMTIDFTKNYRFYFFAGSAGYSIDRIVITDNFSSSGHNGNGSALDPPGSLDIRTVQPTVASASRAACDICNAIYGENITNPQEQCTFYKTGFQLLQEPTDNRLDPIFDEWEMPLRRTKEAIKFFITRLEPKRDQVGFVYYSTSGIAKTELACKRASQVQGIECTTGPNPISYTTVLRNVESTVASGGTPTAYGMVAGLEVLGIATNPPYSSNFDAKCDGTPNSACSRGGSAQRVMILLTDGMPNSTSYRYGCTSNNAPTWSGTNDASHRCPFYFAQLAAQNGITVYTIGLGFGVNRDYLREIARYGNGEAYFSASGGDLNLIFSEILNNIYVRLIE